MAQIGLTGAGQKPARSPGQRTGHRPLSNPPLCPARSSLAIAPTCLNLSINVPGSLFGLGSLDEGAARSFTLTEG